MGRVQGQGAGVEEWDGFRARAPRWTHAVPLSPPPLALFPYHLPIPIPLPCLSPPLSFAFAYILCPYKMSGLLSDPPNYRTEIPRYALQCDTHILSRSTRSARDRSQAPDARRECYRQHCNRRAGWSNSCRPEPSNGQEIADCQRLGIRRASCVRSPSIWACRAAVSSVELVNRNPEASCGLRGRAGQG